MKINILMPMAGQGNRFKSVGYNLPKPLIPIRNNKCMIQCVIENLNISGQYIFVVQKEHEENHQISKILKQITDNPEIIFIDYLTEGATCTCLLAKEYINNDTPLIIVNCDQMIVWNSDDFLKFAEKTTCDGIIVTVKESKPQYSYAKIQDNRITEVAEKKVISEFATAGYYYFSKGSTFVSAAEKMITKNKRVNKEFYLCPVYNEIVEKNGLVYPYLVSKLNCVGTPEELKAYLDMIFIAHRGNINGPDKNENNPKHINHALNLGFDVEVDVWYIQEKGWFLGHDEPRYYSNASFLANEKIWCHAKNKLALLKMREEKNIHYFWHQDDDFTITSKNCIWAHSKLGPVSGTICVMPELSKIENFNNCIGCIGICSDQILKIRSQFLADPTIHHANTP